MDRIDKFVIDFDTWFKKHVLGYSERRNLRGTMRGLSGTEERESYIKTRFPSQATF